LIPARLLCHLTLDALFKVEFPRRITRIGCPFDLDVSANHYLVAGSAGRIISPSPMNLVIDAEKYCCRTRSIVSSGARRNLFPSWRDFAVLEFYTAEMIQSTRATFHSSRLSVILREHSASHFILRGALQ
jgi:hypothetical protein